MEMAASQRNGDSVGTDVSPNPMRGGGERKRLYPYVTVPQRTETPDTGSGGATFRLPCRYLWRLMPGAVSVSQWWAKQGASHRASRGLRCRPACSRGIDTGRRPTIRSSRPKERVAHVLRPGEWEPTPEPPPKPRDDKKDDDRRSITNRRKAWPSNAARTGGCATPPAVRSALPGRSASSVMPTGSWSFPTAVRPTARSFRWARAHRVVDRHVHFGDLGAHRGLGNRRPRHVLAPRAAGPGRHRAAKSVLPICRLCSTAAG